MNTKKKYFLSTMLLVLLLLLVTIGYAYLSTTLSINGSSQINNASWDIHFENVQVTTGSVEATTPVINPNTTVTYNVTLTKPGDFYEFTVDAKNDGSIDAMIDTVLSTLNNTQIQTLPSYLIYTVTYSDGTAITSKQELLSGKKETYKVRIEYKKDLTSSDLPTTEQNLSLSFTTTYAQKDDTSTPVQHPDNFTTDSWSTIVGAVQSGNTDAYNVGDTKEIDLGDFGTHTLRLVNKTTPSECNQEGFSQTSCGFVIEFADIIEYRKMNSTATNVGGWGACEMRTYINSTIYDSLPNDIKNAIINTYVVSGHGSSDNDNIITTDKLYFLSNHEVWTDIYYYNEDSAYDKTRQLDYYSGLNVTMVNYMSAAKKYNDTNGWWGLRTSNSTNNKNFNNVETTGGYGGANANLTFGISPAFRIG